MNDVRFAFRQLLKYPGFTLVATLTLALGVGGNTAIFSIVHAVLLKPLPYPDSDRLVALAERGMDWNRGSIAWPNYTDWQAQQSVFEAFGVYNWTDFVLTGRDQPIQLRGARMTAGAFAALNVRPVAGRYFGPEEDKPGAPSVVVISHALWKGRFGGDRSILGQPILLSGNPYLVLGVMPPGFGFPDELSFWIPAGPFSAGADWQNRGNHPGLYGIARLKPGVTLEQARAELDAIAVRLDAQYPETNKNRRVDLQGQRDLEVGSVRQALWVLLGTVGLVLLIACANVAGLLLARAAGRQKEFALRAALGANRWQIIRPLLAESLLLALLGGTTGLLIATGGMKLILALAGEALPRVAEIRINGGVLLFSAGLALLTALLFGLAPAWQASRPDPQDALQEAARGLTGPRARLRPALVAAQVGLTLLLLIAAGLLMRSFAHLQQVKAGYVHERVVSFRIGLPGRKYPTPERITGFYDQLLESIRALPGVQEASVSSRIPLERGGWDTAFLVEGRPPPPPHERPSMDVQTAGPDYFQTMGIPILRGRPFTRQDHREHVRGGDRENLWGGALNVMIIDEEFSRRHWPGADPIGQRVRMDWGSNSPVMTVVGVVPTVKWRQLHEPSGNAQAYLPFLQLPFDDMIVIVKALLEPDALVSAVRRQVLDLDPDQPIHEVRTLAEMRDRRLAPLRLNVALVGTFAAVALSLAVIGLYGVLAYTVTQRRREIGVRMALGARRRDVLHLVIGQGMRLALIGVALGLAGAFALARVLAQLLFQVRFFDPLTFACVPLLLLAVVAVACWLPARRAAHVDPMEALRSE